MNIYQIVRFAPGRKRRSNAVRGDGRPEEWSRYGETRQRGHVCRFAPGKRRSNAVRGEERIAACATVHADTESQAYALAGIRPHNRLTKCRLVRRTVAVRMIAM